MATTAIGSDRKTGSALERYPDATFQRDNKYFYFGNDGDTSIRFNTTSSVTDFAGVFSLSDATVTLPVPALRTLTHVLNYSDLIVVCASDATDLDIILSDATLVSDSIVTAIKAEITTGFTGGSISVAALSAGQEQDSDAFTGGGTLDIFQSDIQVGALAVSGTGAWVQSDGDPVARITLTGGVASDVDQGKATITIYYMATE